MTRERLITRQAITVLAAAAVGAALGTGVVWRPVVPAAALAIIVSLCLLAVMNRALTSQLGDVRESSRVLRWTIAAFFLHLVVGLVITSTILIDYFGPDALGYHDIALRYLLHWEADFPAPRFPAGKEGFPLLLAVVYRLLSPSPVLGLVVNSLAAAAIVPLMVDVTYRLFGRDAARFVPVLLVFAPGFFIWSSQLLKEAPILFLIALTINCGTRLIARYSVSAVTLLCLAFSVMLTFRAWVALVVGAAMIPAIVWSKREMLAGFGSAASATLISALLVVAFGASYRGYQVAVGSDLREASVVRQGLATANSGFEKEVEFGTVGDAARYLPKGFASVVLGPFPWQVRGVRQLPALCDVAVWWLLLGAFWRGQRRARKLIGRQVTLLLLPGVAVALMLSLSVGNYGTALRERPQFILFLVPLIALGLAEKSYRSGDVPAGLDQTTRLLSVELTAPGRPSPR